MCSIVSDKIPRYLGIMTSRITNAIDGSRFRFDPFIRHLRFCRYILAFLVSRRRNEPNRVDNRERCDGEATTSLNREGFYSHTRYLKFHHKLTLLPRRARRGRSSEMVGKRTVSRWGGLETSEKRTERVEDERTESEPRAIRSTLLCCSNCS